MESEQYKPMFGTVVTAFSSNSAGAGVNSTDYVGVSPSVQAYSGRHKLLFPLCIKPPSFVVPTIPYSVQNKA